MKVNFHLLIEYLYFTQKPSGFRDRPMCTTPFNPSKSQQVPASPSKSQSVPASPSSPHPTTNPTKM